MQSAVIARASVAALALAAAATSQAAVIYDAATGADPTLGYITTTDFTSAGVQYAHPTEGGAAPKIPGPGQVIDGRLDSWTNTYSGTEVPSPFGPGNNTAPLDFVGVTWGSPRGGIVAVRLYTRLYQDGGWFGTATGDPGFNNDAADAADVAAPLVQVTVDGGSSWTTIAATDDYVSIIEPEVLANSNAPILTPATFEFARQDGIDGIRLVGYGGGRSDVGGLDQQGFIGVVEFEVGRIDPVPLPAALPLLAAAVGGLGFTARSRRG